MSLKKKLKKGAKRALNNKYVQYAGGGILGAPFVYAGRRFAELNARGRQQQNEDQAAEEAYYNQMAALGMDELGRYKDIASGKDRGISGEEQTAIDRRVGIEQAQMRQGLASMGIADSSARLSGESQANIDKIGMEEQVRNIHMKEHWDKFVKATGIAEGSSRVLTAMTEEDRKEAMEIYSATVGTIGALAGASSGSSVISEYTGTQHSGASLTGDLA